MVKERGGIDLMPEQGTKPVNKYLMPRTKTDPLMEVDETFSLAEMARENTAGATGLLGWVDRALDRLG